MHAYSNKGNTVVEVSLFGNIFVLQHTSESGTFNKITLVSRFGWILYIKKKNPPNEQTERYPHNAEVKMTEAKRRFQPTH